LGESVAAPAQGKGEMAALVCVTNTHYLRLSKERKRRLSQVIEANEAKRDVKRIRKTPTTSLGLFGLLPCEMQHKLLQEMNLDSLVALGICSRQLMLLVEKFSLSTTGWKTIMHLLTSPNDFKKLGILQRLICAFYSSKKKLKTAKAVLEKVSYRVTLSLTILLITCSWTTHTGHCVRSMVAHILINVLVNCSVYLSMAGLNVTRVKPSI